MPDPHETTRLLQRLGDGDPDAAAELAPIIYGELHRLAQKAMRTTPAGHTLQPTALVNEAWMKLFGSPGIDIRSRSHFIGLAAHAMHSILVDHARSRAAQKRGGSWERVALDQVLLLFEERSIDVLALEDALRDLAAFDEPLARLVQLRCYGGLTHAEIAATEGRSLRSVERDWRTARAWLLVRLEEPDP